MDNMSNPYDTNPQSIDVPQDNEKSSEGKKRNPLKIFLPVFFVILFLGLVGFGVYEYLRIAPRDARFTNVTSNSVTVSWNTKSPTSGTALVFEGDTWLPITILGLGGEKFYDTRDVRVAELEAVKKTSMNIFDSEGVEVSMEDFEVELKVENMGEYYTHHVTIGGLVSETEYSFLVGNGFLHIKVGDSDLGETVTTLEIPEMIEAPYPAYGSVKDAENYYDKPIDELTPVSDAIVYFNYYDELTGEKSSLFSSTVNESGSWYIDVSGAIDKNGDDFLETYRTIENEVFVDLTLDAGPKGIWKTRRLEAITSPATPIVINIPDSVEDEDTVDSVIRVGMFSNPLVLGIFAARPASDTPSGCSTACEFVSYCGPCQRKCSDGYWYDCPCNTQTLANRNCSGTNLPPSELPVTCGGSALGSVIKFGSDCKVCSKRPSGAYYIGAWETDNTTYNPNDGCKERSSSGWNYNTTLKKCVQSTSGKYSTEQACKDANPTGTSAPTGSGWNYNTTLKKCVQSTSGKYSTEQACKDANPTTTTTTRWNYNTTLKECVQSTSGTYSSEQACEDANPTMTTTTRWNYNTTLKECVQSTSGTYSSEQACEDANPTMTTTTGETPSVAQECYETGILTHLHIVKGGKTYKCSQGKLVEVSVESDSRASYCKNLENNTLPHICNVGNYCYLESTGKLYYCFSGTHEGVDGTRAWLPVTPGDRHVQAAYQPDRIYAHQKCSSGNGCLCGSEYLQEGAYCASVNQYSCSPDKEGRICISSTTKYTCQGGACKPSLEGDVEGVMEEFKSENFLDNFISEVGASAEQYVVDTETGILVGIPQGLYTFEYEGNAYMFDVLPGQSEVIIYLDRNNNGQYDEGIDTKISDIASQINIVALSKAHNYQLKEGFNFVSFPFLIPNEEFRTAVGLLKQLNEVYGDIIFSISKYDGGRWKMVGQNTVLYSNNDFQLLPGQGYVIKARGDVSVVIQGQPVKYESAADKAPVTLFEGWNLVGIYGTGVKTYTAQSMIADINASDFTADNVSRWQKDSQMYDGFQVSEGQEYGFDFPINQLESYFVRIKEGRGNWQPKLATQ
jgi:hypothetical protein